MANASYLVEVDFAKDGQYGHALADLTSYVQNMSWGNGMSDPDQEVANPAELRLTLDNSLGDFNLEENSATFYDLFKSGMLIRIRAMFSSTLYTLFIGKIDRIPRSDFAADQRLTVSLVARDMLNQLLRAEFVPDLLTDVTTDVCIQHVFDKAVIALPYYSNYWILDAAQSQLGVNTFLVDTSLPADLEVGKTTLEFFGDNVAEGRSTRAQTYIRDAVAAEMGGRFFYDTRTGKFTFHNRHHDINPALAITVTKADFYNPAYEPQTAIYNRVTVHFTPREVGNPNSILWENTDVIRIDRGETREMIARYTDPDNLDARVGGQDFPVRIDQGVDFIANTQEDGNGADATGNLFLDIENGANSAVITVQNPLKRPLYITTLILRGTPIRSYQQESFTALDPDAIHDTDLSDLTKTLRAVGDRELVADYARGLVYRHKTTRAVFRKITIKGNKNDTMMEWALARTIGDAIRVTDDEINHDKNYVIIGERHRVVGGAQATHEVEWTLKTTALDVYWQLESAGYSELGETTVLAF